VDYLKGEEASIMEGTELEIEYFSLND